MLQPIDSGPRVARAAVGGLHHAAAAARDHGRIARSPEARADLARERARRRCGGRARRAEHGDRAPDARRAREAPRRTRRRSSRMRSASAARSAGGSSPSHSRRLLVERARGRSAPSPRTRGRLTRRRRPRRDARSGAYPAGLEPRPRGACCRAATPSEITYTVRRSARAQAGARQRPCPLGRQVVVLPGARPRAGRGVGGRASCGRRSSAASSEAREVLARVAERAGTVPYLGARSRVDRRARAHAGAPAAASGCSCRPATRGPRSSAYRLPRGADEIVRRASIGPQRSPGRAALQAGLDIRGPADTLGVLLAERAHELQLAAAAGARAGPRLWCLARGVATSRCSTTSPRFWALLERYWPGYRTLAGRNGDAGPLKRRRAARSARSRGRGRPCRSGAGARSSAPGPRPSPATGRSSRWCGRSRTSRGTSRPAGRAPRRSARRSPRSGRACAR